MSTLAEYTVKSPSRGGCLRNFGRWRTDPESGKKIVLIHGPSIPTLVWAPLVPQLVATAYCCMTLATYDASLYVTQLALLLQRIGWPRTRLMGVNLDSAIAAAFVAMFPDLVENGVVLVAFTGIVESSELSRTAKFTSSPIVQALSTNPVIYVRHLVTPPPCLLTIDTTQDAPVHELVHLQSAHLPGFNRAVSSSLRAGPITALRSAFESRAWEGRRVLVVHGTADHTVPPAHSSQLKTLLANSTGAASRMALALVPDAGHALTWTHADTVGAAVCAFLAGG
ncbi:Alpha/Beta hydrolase protein [Mycena vulgaris]|nr:Alpha/Beta hydrolase protein [Mycena vulgaris]